MDRWRNGKRGEHGESKGRVGSTWINAALPGKGLDGPSVESQALEGWEGGEA